MTVQGEGAYRSTQGCAECGAAIDPRSAAYSARGMICRRCEAQHGLRETQAAASAQGGMGALGWGVVSLFCNFFFVPSILAILNASRDLKMLKDPGMRESFGAEAGNIQAKAIIGIVLGCLHPLALVGLFALLVMGAAVGAMSGPRYDGHYGDPYYDGYGGTYGDTYDDLYAPTGGDPLVQPPSYGSDPIWVLPDPSVPADDAYDPHGSR